MDSEDIDKPFQYEIYVRKLCLLSFPSIEQFVQTFLQQSPDPVLNTKRTQGLYVSTEEHQGLMRGLHSNQELQQGLSCCILICQMMMAPQHI